MRVPNDGDFAAYGGGSLNPSAVYFGPCQAGGVGGQLRDWQRVASGNRMDEWFRLATPRVGVVLIEEPWHDERVKSYLITGANRALLLDTGMGVGDLRSVVARLTDLPVTVVLSHAHWDHIGSTHQFIGDAEILVHPLAAPELRVGISQERMRRYLATEHLSGPFTGVDLAATAVIPGVEPTRLIEHGATIDLGDRVIDVVHAPGHTAGLIVLWDPATATLFSTDAAYAGALYAQMADSNLADYHATLTLLADLDPVPRRLYPAHGESPVAPELLPVMRDAMGQVMTGRQPDTRAGDVATFKFGRFSILTSWPLAAEARS
jgi:glyoxylase-like metal-dependent hydrolase (beta-lactamase superfamily II)